MYNVIRFTREHMYMYMYRYMLLYGMMVEHLHYNITDSITYMYNIGLEI